MADQISYDVVIVGAGIAGAQMAYKLAKNGKKVLVLEAGDLLPNVAQEGPVKQDALNKFYGKPIKDPSVPWPGTKDPSIPWETSDVKAPRPTSPGVNSDNTQGEAWSMAKLEGKPGNYLQQTGKYAFGSTYERVAGGTTKHWLGTCLRFSPDDFKVVSKYNPPIPGAQEWPITYDQLEPYYGQAENEIGVAGDANVDKKYGVPRSTEYPMGPIPQSYLDQILQQRLNGKNIDGNALDIVSTPQGRNSVVFDNRPACMGNSSCVPICPINAKYDAGVHVSKIMNDPTLSALVTFSLRSVAYQVTVNPADNTISGIKYKVWSKDSSDVVDTIAIGKQYVIASHAIETAKLLLNSPWKDGLTVANSSNMVGRNLMDHICLVVWGNLKAENGNGYFPVFPYRGPMSTSGIETFRNTPQRSKTAAFRIEVGNDGWQWPYGGPEYSADNFANSGLVGKDLLNAVVNEVNSQVRFALELETISGDDTLASRVTLSNDKDALGIPRPSVNYVIPQYTLDGYAYAINVAEQLFSGAMANIDNKTLVPAFPLDPNNPPAGYLTFKPTGSDQEIAIEFRGAGHLIGTHRMGTDPKLAVTDADLKSFDHGNLFLVGCGAFPTTATSNPTLTLSALALRAVDKIIAELH
jgi:glucose dehydrogenase